jgi:hypothetical protein
LSSLDGLGNEQHAFPKMSGFPLMKALRSSSPDEKNVCDHSSIKINRKIFLRESCNPDYSTRLRVIMLGGILKIWLLWFI